MKRLAPPPTVQSGRLKLQAHRYITPPPRVSSAEWLSANVTMPEGTETGGQPFSLAAFPHVDGVLEAFDDPSVRTIVLQWGTRLGKTTTCLSLMSKQAGTNPRNMMFAGSTKDAAGRVVESRLYPILAATDGVKDQLLSESRRSKLAVKLQACRIFVGWSGSETSLADVGAFFGVANEIDKWDQDVSSEADSLALFLNRFKGFPNHKIILESTPTIKGKSRIETWLYRANRHRRYVPCPHCGEFQILRKGEEETPGGIKWERTDGGQSDPDLAFRTAYYECQHCKGRIDNYHRVPMLRRGKWVADGCTIDKTGTIHSVADRALSDVVGFGPLPSWYALTETWGNFARAWIRAKKRPRDLQDVINSYCAETWEAKRTLSTPERVAERISGTTPAGIVPHGGLFLTVTVDRQEAGGGFNPWVVLAHGADDRVWEVEKGVSQTLEAVWNDVMRREFQHADGGPNVIPSISAIDSGWNTRETYDFCNSHPGILACKGSGDLSGKPFDLRDLDSKSVQEGQSLFLVNTDFWENELQHRLDQKLANEPGSLTLSLNSKRDMEFLDQLCNGMLADKVDSRGNAKLLWVKKEDSQPNDFRDAIRYGLALGRAWIEAEGLPLRHQVAVQKPLIEPPAAFVRAPDQSSTGGWIRRSSR